MNRHFSKEDTNGQGAHENMLNMTVREIQIKTRYHFILIAAAAAKSLQSCPTLCNPTDSSPPGSSVPGFSRQEYWSGLTYPFPMRACMKSRFSHVQLCATLWTAAHQAPPSTGFSRQEYWSGLPFPSPSYSLECQL